MKGSVIFCNGDGNLFHDGDDDGVRFLTVLEVTFRLTQHCRDGSPS